MLQGQEFYAEGTYARCWVPELRNVPTEHIRVPRKLPESEQKRLGGRIGKDYPAAPVDPNAACQRALAACGEARKQANA